MVTEIARKMLLKRLCLTLILDHTIGKRWIDTSADFQKTNTSGYPVNMTKNSSSAKNKFFIVC